MLDARFSQFHSYILQRGLPVIASLLVEKYLEIFIHLLKTGRGGS